MATGSGENRTWLKKSATPPPISASISRWMPASPPAAATARIALTPAWTTTIRAPPAACAIDIATKVASAIPTYGLPTRAAVASPTMIPSTTPDRSRTVCSPRSPRGAFNATTADIGAKKGSGWPAMRSAITQADAAPSVAWKSRQAEPAHRPRAPEAVAIALLAWPAERRSALTVAAPAVWIPGRVAADRPSPPGIPPAEPGPLPTRSAPGVTIRQACSASSPRTESAEPPLRTSRSTRL